MQTNLQLFPQQNTAISEYKIPFTISEYITTLILPKCVIAYGESIATVYLQIALNINHQKQLQKWKKESCWAQPSTISKNTGYNPRTVMSMLKTLEELQLIKIKKRGNLSVYSLRNHNLSTQRDINKFNLSIESKILDGLDTIKTKKIMLLFEDLDYAIEAEKSFFDKDIEKSIWFPDVNLLRNWISEIEKIYKGSSLFFLNNIAPTVFKRKTNSLSYMSEKKRSIFCGSSQTTVGRYIDRFIEANLLVVEEGNINKPIKLSLNYEFLNKNINQGVVNDLMSNEKFICPICERGFSDKRSFGVHISKTTDAKHVLLNKLKKENLCSAEDIAQLYLDNKEKFDLLDNKIEEPLIEQKPIPQNNYLSIPCDCKMSCQECYKNWKSDFYDDCTHERKAAFTSEYLNKKQPAKEIEVKKEDFNIVKPMKKQASAGSAPSLLKYFYSLNNGVSPNFGKECAQIKNLLTKGYTSDDIKITMDFLNRKGNIDLRFLNRSINEALVEKQYLDETNKEGTEAFLVKMFYEGLGQTINIQTLVRDVQKIKETMNTGLNYDQTKLVVQYMIEIKCPTLNFIGSKRIEALTKMEKKNSIQNNPSFNDRDDIVVIQNELINGRTSLRKVNEKFKPEAVTIATSLFKESKFAAKYTHLEWAWKIGLELNKEMFQFALQAQQNKEYLLDKGLKNPKLSEKEKQSLVELKRQFDEWLQNQTQRFAN